MEIQIELPTKNAAKNFEKWFREEGFDLFTKSKFNKLKKSDQDSYVTCLSTDEHLQTIYSNDYAGHFFELQN